MEQPKLPKGTPLKLSKVYENAKLYEEFSVCEDYNKNILKTILKLVDFKNKIILDLGAGCGRFTIPFASKAEGVYALDKSKPMLQILKRKIKKKNINNIKIIVADFGKTHLPKNSVDIVFSSWAFPAHSKNWDRDLKEIKRVLKKRGIMILVEVFYRGEYFALRKKTQNPAYFKQAQKFNRDMYKWFISKDFKHKVINTTVNFKSKSKTTIKKICSILPFLGPDFGEYLLSKNKISYKEPISIFYWKKRKDN